MTFNDFLVHLTPIVIALIVVLIGLCRWLFASALVVDPSRVKRIMALNEREAIGDPRLLVISLVVLGIVLVAFVLHPLLGYEPSVVALLGSGLLVAVSRVSTEESLQDVEWGTLAFFTGLFVMVGGLVNTGVLGALTSGIAGFAEGNLLAFTGVLLWGSGVLPGIVDNSRTPPSCRLVQPPLMWPYLPAAHVMPHKWQKRCRPN